MPRRRSSARPPPDESHRLTRIPSAPSGGCLLHHAPRLRGRGLPPRIAAPCCAEFVVSRDAVRRRPKEFYAAALDWIAASELSSKAIAISVEFVWHLIFQPEQPWLVVEQKECLCQLYGLRNLPPQFADSPDIAVNTAFLVLALFSVGAAALVSYLKRFPFYRPRNAESRHYIMVYEYLS
jgi:hypothetical protein